MGSAAKRHASAPAATPAPRRTTLLTLLPCAAWLLAIAASLTFSLLDNAATPAHAQSAQTRLTDRGQIYTFRQVSEALVCQCGCNMILYVCNHVNCPSAYPFRDSIEAMILRGNSKDEIIARFVADEGEVVLSAPTTEGFNLAAWVTPFVMLVLGGVFLLSFLRARQRRAAGQGARASRAGVTGQASGQSASASPPSSPGTAPADSYAARVDEELGGFRD